MTKRDTAIHATCALSLKFIHRHVIVEFVPVQNSQQRIAITGDLSFNLFEARWLSHRLIFLRGHQAPRDELAGKSPTSIVVASEPFGRRLSLYF